jgi:hypothetical protein
MKSQNETQSRNQVDWLAQENVVLEKLLQTALAEAKVSSDDEIPMVVKQPEFHLGCNLQIQVFDSAHRTGKSLR